MHITTPHLYSGPYVRPSVHYLLQYLLLGVGAAGGWNNDIPMSHMFVCFTIINITLFVYSLACTLPSVHYLLQYSLLGVSAAGVRGKKKPQ